MTLQRGINTPTVGRPTRNGNKQQQQQPATAGLARGINSAVVANPVTAQKPIVQGALASGSGVLVSGGSVSLGPINDGDLLANTSGDIGVPVDTAFSAYLDYLFGNPPAQGSILYRGASLWTVLGPGTNGQGLVTGGPGANPSWGSSGQQIYNTFITPVNGNFSWLNQGSASVTVNTNGGIFLLCPTQAAASIHARVLNSPATPYTFTACFLPQLINIDFQKAGLCFVDSASGKLIIFSLQQSATEANVGFVVQQFTNTTTFSATVKSQKWYRAADGLLWMRIKDDGTNRLYSVSSDGYNFVQVFSETRTTFLTANQVGWFVDESDNTYQCGMTLLSWAQS